MKTFNGYKKRDLNNTNVLLADGSTTTIAAILDPLKNYVLKAGDTMSGLLTLPSIKASANNSVLVYNSSGNAVLHCGTSWTILNYGASSTIPLYLDGKEIYMRIAGSDSNGLYINNSANVGIGTTSPAYKLDVNGTIRASGGIVFTKDTECPEFSSYPPYLLGIESFANGGRVKWKGWADCRVGYATTAGSAPANGGTADSSLVLLTNNTSLAADACYSESPGLRFWRFNGTGNNVGGGDGWIMSWSWNPGSVGGQIYLDDNPSKTMLIRGWDSSSKTFNSWAKILHSENWSTYCAAASHTHTKSLITDFPTSMPASDVYSWAKASVKPSYNFSEISAGNIVMGDGANYFLYRTDASRAEGSKMLRSGFYFHTTGRESVVFANQYAHTGWIFANGIDPVDRKAWNALGVTPALLIHHNAIYINRAVRDADSADYNLYVGGTSYFDNAINTRASTGGSTLYGIKFGSCTLGSLSSYPIFFDCPGIRFTDGHEWDWDAWAGLKYVNSSKTIYLGIAGNGAIFEKNTGKATNGVILCVNIDNIKLAGSSGNSYTVYHTGNKPSKSDVGLGNVDNTADANKSVNYATSAGSAPANGGTSTTTNRINIQDIRNATRNTSYFDAQRATLWFNNTGTPDGNWYSGIHMKGWTNGYLSWELCSGSTTSLNGNLYYRNGINDSWLGWKTIAFTDSNITGTAAGITGKTLVTASSVCTTNWSTYASNHIPTMSFMAYWNGAYSGTSSNLTYCANGTIIGTSNYTSYCATANHNHTYNVNDSWLREYNDDNYFKCYGNSRSMVFRTDGTTGYSDCGGYPFVFNYGGDSAGYRKMLISTGGDIWGSGIGWVSTIKSTADGALQRSGGTMTGAITTGANRMGICFRDGNATWDTYCYHASTGNEALVFASLHANTSFIFYNGDSYANISSSRWQSLPGVLIVGKGLRIGNISTDGTNGGYSLYAAGTGYFGGNVTSASNFYANSDIRYKNIVEYIEPSVTYLATLPIFNYTWTNRDDNKLRTGTSAQSVELVLPNLVTEDSEGFKSLDYATLGAVAGITACKELVKCKAEIEELKDKINKLQAALANKADKLRRMGPSYLR